MPDNVYIWVRKGRIAIARGESVGQAIKALEGRYGKESLVEKFGIADYDGYFSVPDFILPEPAPTPVGRRAILLEVRMEFSEPPHQIRPLKEGD